MLCPWDLGVSLHKRPTRQDSHCAITEGKSNPVFVMTPGHILVAEEGITKIKATKYDIEVEIKAPRAGLKTQYRAHS